MPTPFEQFAATSGLTPLQMLGALLQQYETPLLALVDQGDVAVFNMLVATVGKNNPLIASILSTMQGVVEPEIDAVAKQVLDGLIAQLSAAPASK